MHLRDAVGQAVLHLDPGRPRLVCSGIPHGLVPRRLEETVGELFTGSARLRPDPATLGRPDDELVAVDTSPVLAVREEAIASHRSQVSPFDGLPPELRRAFLTTDHVEEVPVGPGDRAAAGQPPLAIGP